MVCLTSLITPHLILLAHRAKTSEGLIIVRGVNNSEVLIIVRGVNNSERC